MYIYIYIYMGLSALQSTINKQIAILFKLIVYQFSNLGAALAFTGPIMW